jgi:Fe-S cluster assembly iron-binding protein IscA
LTLDESKDSKDNLLDADGFKILVDDQVKFAVYNGEQLVIDFRKSYLGSGFTIDNGAHCC